MALTELGQIHISVTDLERSVVFYRDVLGLPHLLTSSGRPMAFFMAGPVRLYLSVTENEQFRSRPVVYYRVDDVVADHATVVQRGAVSLSDPHVVHRDGAAELWMAFVADPDGTPIGLMTERATLT
jgi:catechol 2,3-dioxygenase-like lactoylglutathione lyase family enzyme